MAKAPSTHGLTGAAWRLFHQEFKYLLVSMLKTLLNLFGQVSVK